MIQMNTSNHVNSIKLFKNILEALSIYKRKESLLIFRKMGGGDQYFWYLEITKSVNIYTSKQYEPWINGLTMNKDVMKKKSNNDKFST